MVWTADLVAGRFDTTQGLADDSISSANLYMEELNNFLDALVVPNSDDVNDIVFPEIAPIDFTSRPSFTAQLESFPTFNDDLPTSPTLKSIPESELETPNIVEVSDPGTMSYSESEYSSPIRSDIFAKLLNDIRYGGTGLNATVENDIYNRGRERQRVENEALYSATEERFTATGFSLPTGALASALQAANEEISRKNDQLSREIAINQADLEQKNVQFSMDLALKAESILTDFYNRQENRLFEAAKEIAKSTIDIYNSITANQNLKVDRYKIDAEVFKIETERLLSENEILIKEYDTRIKAFMSQIDREVNTAQLQVEAFKTEAMAFEAETKSTSMYYDAITKESATEVQAFTARLQQQISILESSTNGYIALKSLQEKGFEGIMNVNAQLAASAMNAVNVSASQSISSSTSN